jgi:hypothetical protein
MSYRAYSIPIVAASIVCVAVLTSGCETTPANPKPKATVKTGKSKKHYEYIMTTGSSIPKRVEISDDGIYTDESGNPVPNPNNTVSRHQIEQLQRSSYRPSPAGGS